MEYLHTMVRVRDLEESLNFYCKALGLVEVSRSENKAGRFTLIFLAAPGDLPQAKEDKTPLVELTYNWPVDGQSENYTGGRNFGHLAYRVKNIYETCQKLMDHGVSILRPPRDGYMAFIRSPDQISIELLQSGEPLPPKEPWSSMKNQGVW
jgi:lactoylglutathione lyase